MEQRPPTQNLHAQARGAQRAAKSITPRVVKKVIAFLAIRSEIKDSGISDAVKGTVNERQRVAQLVHFGHHFGERDKAMIIALRMELVDAV